MRAFGEGCVNGDRGVLLQVLMAMAPGDAMCALATHLLVPAMLHCRMLHNCEALCRPNNVGHVAITVHMVSSTLPAHHCAHAPACQPRMWPA